MKITDIQRTKRGRYSVFIDGEFDGVICSDVFAMSSIAVGADVQRDYLDELYSQSSLMITKERAFRLLGQRSYTAKGLFEKLASYTDEESAKLVVERMKELNLIDDEDYARRFASDCFNLKGYSARRTALELARKGINREIIDKTLESIEHDPQKAISRIILRKYQNRLGDEKGEKRTIDALLRLGYGYGDIKTVVNCLKEDINYYNYE